jgi:hypothetical protein
MAGDVIVDQIQLGQNTGTPGNNFVITNPNNGTLKIQRGLIGGAITDVMTIGTDGKITSAFDIAAAQFDKSVNGYCKLANGLIIQWGTKVIGTAANGTSAVTFPIAFPNALLAVSAIDRSNDSNKSCLGVAGETTTGFNITWFRVQGTATGDSRWFAIGY